METFRMFYGYITIIFGLFMTLIGFRIYEPTKVFSSEEFHEKYGVLFKFGGLGLLLWGIFKIQF